MEKRDVGSLLPSPQFIGRQIQKSLVKFEIVLARLSARIKHLVISFAPAVVVKRSRMSVLGYCPGDPHKDTVIEYGFDEEGISS
jgi:hypothetical protein